MFSVALYTLGCKLNQLESEALADAFRQAGFSLVPWSGASAAEAFAVSSDPDILVINTCTVTSKSDQKARRIIRKALRDYPRSCVIVAGCYARLDGETIEALEGEAGCCNVPEGRRLFVQREKAGLLGLPRYVQETAQAGDNLQRRIESWFRNAAAEKGYGGKTGAGSRVGDGTFSFTPEQFSFHSRGFLKIQDGCNKHCTYCRVRLARGPGVSLPAEQALAELRALEEKGYREAVLTGVNISQYQDDALGAGSGGLGALLDYLLGGTRHINLRLSSLEPDGIDAALIQAVAHPRLRPHFHLSVQSGSQAVLAKMGRSYSGETVEQAAALLRSVKNDPFLACDIITGFPGESPAEFEKTLALCKNIRFAWIHAFPYSKRPGTPAASWPQTVSEGEAVGRVDMLLDLARQGRRDYIQGWMGCEVEALVEGDEKKAGYCRGLSDNYLKLLIRHAGPSAPGRGTALRCRIGELRFQGQEGSYDAEAEDIFSIMVHNDEKK